MFSICVFGSRARQTADALSDGDVLLIGDGGPSLELAASPWRSSGWNVTHFPHQPFKRMAQVKALFIQHIKLEGRIVRDDGRFLSSVLSEFRPKADYSPEKKDAAAHLAQLPHPGQYYWADLCVGDIMHVFFRNLAILHLASRGIYTFDYRSLVDLMADEFQLPAHQRTALLSLRDMKHAYRSRRVDTSLTLGLPTAREATSAIVDRLPELERSSIADGATTDTYFRLRCSELELVRRYDPRWLDERQPHERWFEEWRTIRGSAGYPKTTLTH